MLCCSLGPYGQKSDSTEREAVSTELEPTACISAPVTKTTQCFQRGPLSQLGLKTTVCMQTLQLTEAVFTDRCYWKDEKLLPRLRIPDYELQMNEL